MILFGERGGLGRGVGDLACVGYRGITGAEVLHGGPVTGVAAVGLPDLDCDLLERAVGQPRRYRAEDPFVLGRLSALLRGAAWQAAGDTAEAGVSQLDRLRHAADEQDFDTSLQAALHKQAQCLRAAPGRRWPTSPFPGESTG